MMKRISSHIEFLFIHTADQFFTYAKIKIHVPPSWCV